MHVVLHEIEAAADDTRIGDRLRATVATIRRQHRLGAEPMASVADFDTLRAQMLDLRYNERLAYQEATGARPPAD